MSVESIVSLLKLVSLTLSPFHSIRPCGQLCISWIRSFFFFSYFFFALSYSFYFLPSIFIAADSRSIPDLSFCRLAARLSTKRNHWIRWMAFIFFVISSSVKRKNENSQIFVFIFIYRSDKDELFQYKFTFTILILALKSETADPAAHTETYTLGERVFSIFSYLHFIWWRAMARVIFLSCVCVCVFSFLSSRLS